MFLTMFILCQEIQVWLLKTQTEASFAMIDAMDIIWHIYRTADLYKEIFL